MQQQVGQGSIDAALHVTPPLRAVFAAFAAVKASTREEVAETTVVVNQDLATMVAARAAQEFRLVTALAELAVHKAGLAHALVDIACTYSRVRQGIDVVVVMGSSAPFRMATARLRSIRASLAKARTPLIDVWTCMAVHPDDDDGDDDEGGDKESKEMECTDGGQSDCMTCGIEQAPRSCSSSSSAQ